jgi:asparagine synthase (glutamine-hydrolysing)
MALASRASVLSPSVTDGAFARYESSLNAGRDQYDTHLRYSVASRLPDLLRFEDRNAMAFGIESRTPFLDVRLVELAFGAASSFRLRDGWTKWVLRKSVEPMLPPQVVWRRGKVGFETPQRRWLSAWPGGLPVDASIEALDGVVVSSKARRSLRDAASGAAGSEGEALAWRLLVSAAWQRRWASA